MTFEVGDKVAITKGVQIGMYGIVTDVHSLKDLFKVRVRRNSDAVWYADNELVLIEKGLESNVLGKPAIHPMCEAMATASQPKADPSDLYEVLKDGRTIKCCGLNCYISEIHYGPPTFRRGSDTVGYVELPDIQITLKPTGQQDLKDVVVPEPQKPKPRMKKITLHEYISGGETFWTNFQHVRKTGRTTEVEVPE